MTNLTENAVLAYIHLYRNKQGCFLWRIRTTNNEIKSTVRFPTERKALKAAIKECEIYNLTLQGRARMANSYERKRV